MGLQGGSHRVAGSSLALAIAQPTWVQGCRLLLGVGEGPAHLQLVEVLLVRVVLVHLGFGVRGEGEGAG
eukprot:scaffold54153_cov38-Phaeocystis_antarctica.AAC.1